MNIERGQLWRHIESGVVYKVMVVANKYCDREDFPKTVVYTGVVCSKVYARPASVFINRFVLVEG